MARSLLQLVDAAAGEIGLSQPTQLVGNTNTDAVQMLALANRQGVEQAREGNAWGGWPDLRKSFTFSLNPVSGFTGTITSGSSTITGLNTTTGIVVGYGIVASGIPLSGTVVSINAASSSVTMSAPATGSYTGTSISFGQIIYPGPTDLGWYMPQTGWDANFRWQLLGPLDEQEWDVLQYGISPAGPRIRFKIQAGQIYVNPCPSATQKDLIAFQYISNAWCKNATTSVGQSVFALDTDLLLIDEDVFIMGMKWRLLRAKMLNYQQEYKDYTRALDRVKARAGGSRSLPLNASQDGIRLLNNQNVPDSGFGS